MTILEDRPTSTIGPGVYDDMPSAEYHANPALSASGMRKLLPPSCPAQFRYDMDHPQPPKKEFDFGHIAHRLVLGAGEEFEVCQFDNWTTKASKDAKAAARAAGKIPLLPADMAKAKEMADAVKAHPLAGKLFQGGRPEQSLFWKDPASGVDMRARLDWLSDPSDSRLIIADYKTTTDVDIDEIGRSVWKWGYNVQAAQYVNGARALGIGGGDTVMVFVFQAKTAPYLIRVVQLDMVSLRIGQARIRAAVEVFQECTYSGNWPGYDEIDIASLPGWAEKRDTEDYLP